MSLIDGLADFVASILAFFYSLPVLGGSYGLAIILLTFTLMVMLMPLTLKATRSTIKMSQLQPELRRIQKEYKQDRETMNAELMKLYSENGVNPVGGCLPMIAQMPVFIVLFQIIRGLTRRVDELAFYDVAARLREARELAPLNGQTFSPQFLEHDTALFRDLSTHTEMKFGPLDLAAQAWDVVRSDFVAAVPYILLVLFVVAASFYQQKQVTARRSPDTQMSPMMQQQQQLLKILPVLTGVWSFAFPAGLVLYWAASSTFRIGQQAYITHQIYGKEAVESPSESPTRAKNDSVDDEQSQDPIVAKSDDESEESDSPSKKPASDNQSEKADKAAERRAEWEARRKKSQAKKKDAKAKGPDDAVSSRLTPKGTQPGRSKSKRKR